MERSATAAAPHRRRRRRGTRTGLRRSRTRSLPSSAATPSSTPLVSTGSARRSTGAWTLSDRSTSTTRVEACTPSRSSPTISTCCGTRCSATRTPSTRPPRRQPSWSSVRARRCCATSTRRDEYCVVFTPNATGALKLVGEAYPFEPGSRFLLTSDNHNSVNGIREFARACGRDDDVPAQHAAFAACRRRPARGRPATGRTARGTTCSPTRPSRTSRASSIRSTGSPTAQAAGWDVLVDCAAFVPTNRLDLSEWQPDFVADLALQAARVPDRRRLPARSQAGSCPAAPALVRRRHHRHRERSG